jgi:hypothetical protein
MGGGARDSGGRWGPSRPRHVLARGRSRAPMRRSAEIRLTGRFHQNRIELDSTALPVPRTGSFFN